MNASDHPPQTFADSQVIELVFMFLDDLADPDNILYKDVEAIQQLADNLRYHVAMNFGKYFVEEFESEA